MSLSDSESDSYDEKIKIVYKGLEKEINTPYSYKEMLREFLKAFNADKSKEYIFFYKDKGKEYLIDKEVTLSDFFNIDKIYVKESKDEKENEDEKKEEIEKKPLNDLEHNLFCNQASLPKISYDIKIKSSTEQETNITKNEKINVINNNKIKDLEIKLNEEKEQNKILNDKIKILTQELEDEKVKNENLNTIKIDLASQLDNSNKKIKILLDKLNSINLKSYEIQKIINMKNDEIDKLNPKINDNSIENI